MVNSIGGGMRHNPPDFFKKIDEDGSGGISQAELTTVAEKIKEKTGQALDVSDEAFTSYDKDGSGELSADELKSVMENSGFGPPHGVQSGNEPPPPPPRQATGSYDSNSGTSATSPQDALGSLIENLKTLLDTLSSSTEPTDSTSTVQGAETHGRKHGGHGLFAKADMDGSGGISPDELKSLSDNLEKVTGKSLDASDTAFNNYDTDGDGVLNAKELKGAMAANGFGRPNGTASEDGIPGQGSEGVSVSGDQIQELKKLLEQLTKYSGSSASGSKSIVSVTT